MFLSVAIALGLLRRIAEENVTVSRKTYVLGEQLLEQSFWGRNTKLSQLSDLMSMGKNDPYILNVTNITKKDKAE